MSPPTPRPVGVVSCSSPSEWMEPGGGQTHLSGPHTLSPSLILSPSLRPLLGLEPHLIDGRAEGQTETRGRRAERGLGEGSGRGAARAKVLREALAVCTPPAPEPSAKRPGS